MADSGSCSCSSSSSSDDDDDEGDIGSCSCCSTVEANNDEWLWRRRRRRSSPESTGTRHRRVSGNTATAAEATSFGLLDAGRLTDLLDPERLVSVLDGCLGSKYVRGCVVETWDEVLSDHLDAISHLVLYQTPEHSVSTAVYEQLTELSAALRPTPTTESHGTRPARVNADRVYGTLKSAARSLLTTRVDACCRQSMCRAVGLAVVALRTSTRPVFSVENFTVEINEAANFANLYCTGYARRICAALKDIYDAVMAGDYHPTNVLVQMAVMEKSIEAALRTLADGRATATQKTIAQRSLLAELDGICATVRLKNYGCVDAASSEPNQQVDVVPQNRHRATMAATAVAAGRFVHFTMSPWRAPIRMYHQQSVASVNQVLKTAVQLVETLVAEIFKPCLNNKRQVQRGYLQRACARRCSHRPAHSHDKQL